MTLVELKYGWTILSVVTNMVTNSTIYVAGDTRQQLSPYDFAEILLRTWECCEATRTGTNTWRTTPLTYVTTWRDTNGNINVTNAIGWHPDRDLMIANDAKIMAVITNYSDPNYNTYTVTGLWAILQIGDKTNKFTSTPCWTNVAQTNWVVHYTNFWPNTNGTSTNICYTSYYQRVVHYASNWTATGGYVWVTVSNWPTIIIQDTNAATYGDLPWQIYIQDLQERYKVLYMLTNAEHDSIATTLRKVGNSDYNLPETTNGHPTIALARAAATNDYNGDAVQTNTARTLQETAQEAYELTGYYDTNAVWIPYDAYYCTLVKYVTKFEIVYLSSNLEHKADFYIYPDLVVSGDYCDFYDQGIGLVQSSWNGITMGNWTFNTGATSVWVGGNIYDPVAPGIETPTEDYPNYWRGFMSYDDKVITGWKFLYCTNKWW